jgi:predicted permease
LVLKALLSNPLILGCVAGIFYANMLPAFPVFVDNTLRLTSLVTLPLALLSIGGSLTLGSFKTYARPSLAAAAVKLLILPVCGYLLMVVFDVGAAAMRVGMIYFALPTSTAIYVLSSQLNSDTRLASATIVVSTVLSMVSLTAVLALF